MVYHWRRGYRVEARIADRTKAAEVLSALDWVRGISYKGDGDWLRIQAPPERAPELLAALAAHGLFPFEVRPVVSTLETVFLGLTDKDAESPNV